MKKIATDVSEVLEYQFNSPSFQMCLITYSAWIASAESCVFSLDPVTISSREWGFYFQKYEYIYVYIHIYMHLHTCVWIQADIL